MLNLLIKELRPANSGLTGAFYRIARLGAFLKHPHDRRFSSRTACHYRTVFCQHQLYSAGQHLKADFFVLHVPGSPWHTFSLYS
jgi:hypothetical protein